MRRTLFLVLAIVSLLAIGPEARAEPIVRTATTATSKSGHAAGANETETSPGDNGLVVDDPRSPGTPPFGRRRRSPGIRLAHSFATALARGRLRRRATHRGFAGLETSEQRVFLEEWDRITEPNARTRRVALELRERHEKRLRTERPNRKSKAQADTEQLAPDTESGLIVGEIAAAAFVTLVWKFLFGVAASGVELTSSSAVSLVAVDFIATSLIAGAVTYGIGSLSDHYAVSFGTTVAGAALGYGATVLFAVTVVSTESPSNRFSNEVSIGTGALVAVAVASILTPAIGAAIGLNADKVPYAGTTMQGSVDPWTTIARRERPRPSAVQANVVSLGF